MAPPLLVEAYRRWCRPPTWQGVYADLGQVPAATPPERTRGWRRSAVEPGAYSSFPPEVLQDHAFLAVLAAAIYRQNGGRLHVLDFGGGLGISYVHLVHSLAESSGVQYDVVELEWACEEGARVFQRDDRIRFHRSLPEQAAGIDILNVTSALEYVAEYAAMLKRLCACRARYFLFAGLPAGEFPSFATAQHNIQGAVLPQWFFNVQEIIGIMNESGYSLIFRGQTAVPTRQSNFPLELRMPRERSAALLFARSDSRTPD